MIEDVCGRKNELDFTGIVGWMNRPWAFRTALVFVALIYLGSVTPFWYPTSDSALYLMLGDNLAAGHGYMLWGKPHLHVPPGFPLLLAGLRWVGIESDFARNLVMMLLAWGTLVGCYFALRELVSTTLAKWLILLVATSHVMHHTSVCQLSDIPFMGIVWLGLWCQLRGIRTGSWSLEMGSCLLLASCLLRVVGVPIAVGAAVGLLLQQSHISRKRIWMNAGGTMLCMLLVVGIGAVYVFFLSQKQTVPSYLNSVSFYMTRFWESGILRPFQNVLRTSPELSTLLTGQKNQAINFFILLIWVPVVIGVCVCWKRQQTFGICVLACYLLPLMLMRPLIARYLLPLSPLIYWYALEGVRWFCDRSPQWQPRGQRVVAACMVLLLMLNVPKAGKLAYRLHYPKTDNAYAQQQALEEIADYLRETASPGELFITNADERILAYKSGLWTVPQVEIMLSRKSRSLKSLHEVVTPGVTYLVVNNFSSSRTKRLRVLLKRYSSAQMVYETKEHRIYRIGTDLAGQSLPHFSAGRVFIGDSQDASRSFQFDILKVL
jgi:hypothetical protein